MISVCGKNADEVFKKLSKLLVAEGFYSERLARGLKTRELAGTVHITLENPNEAVCKLPSRKMSYEYLQAEMDWYLSGSLFVDVIGKNAKMWKVLADSNGTVNSNYGFLALVEKWSGKSQLEWCISRLKKDVHTRQAVINYNQPRHKYDDVKDFVCTISQQFIVRNGMLDTVVYMRSNDLIYGLSYDMPWFCYLLKKVAKETGLKVGKYEHIAASLHVYEKHFNTLKDMAGIKGLKLFSKNENNSKDNEDDCDC